MQVGNFITAVRAGWILKNPETWKNRQIAINALAGLMAAGVAISKALNFPLPVTEDQIVALAGGVWAVVSVFNSWATAATTDKVGLPPKPADPPDAWSGPGSNG